MFNPFPGLRPFEADEDHLFFGREKEVDELLRRLRTCRFLSIIGTSGSGKSSLVRSGLIPSLYGGFMVGTNLGWRIAVIRPGEDPMLHLAEALSAPDVLGDTEELGSTNRVIFEATLRRGARGLVEAVRQARALAHDKLLVVVDQFEEIFRFRRTQAGSSRNDAVAFVRLLLEAAQQKDIPIYIVITMRSDFIGDCMDFAGLPEAVNSGLYLVPRMTRDELRSAITGPVAVGGGKITQRLVLRLLNDFGDEYDQLPVLQHALMRTWSHWANRSPSAESIDIEDYEAIGSFRQALSKHAEEAYEETGSEDARKVTERIFKALTDTFSDHRGIRRPTSVGDLIAVSEPASMDDVIRIIEIFRQPGRSFLMPPADVPLNEQSIIDLSHESLMRCWERLTGWAEQERISADIYNRLTDAARWFEEGRAGLWRNPELEVGQKWKLENRPTAAWAQRYNSSFAQVMNFLDRSEEERQRQSAEKARERQKKLRQTQWAAGILASLLLAALFLAFLAWKQTRRAERNLELARRAVDESLSSAGRDQAREASDMPQMEKFRMELLDKAETFYALFVRQNSDNPALRSEEARANSRLGDINRLMGRHIKAAEEYNKAIAGFTDLAKTYPGRGEFRQALAYARNWLGETIRDALEKQADVSWTPLDAEKEYSEALRLQNELHTQQPADTTYQQELARTYYNRGIIRYRVKDSQGTLSDFREAIDLLEPLITKRAITADTGTNPSPAQDLARVYNNYANVASSTGQIAEAQAFYEKAVALAEQLVNKNPESREYKVELAKYCGNEAKMLVNADEPALAEPRSRCALELLEELAKPTPSLSVNLAWALQLQGQLLQERDPEEAKILTDQALNLLQKDNKAAAKGDLSYSAIYMNLGANYLELAEYSLQRGDIATAKSELANLGRILPYLSPDDKQALMALYPDLQGKLLKGPTRH